ncbi:hypothetical protein FRB98_002948 [Tulasnella sp. 332]|nr:hypothetical protein FRB98_002948 [Tulasnella sp. 332]
MCLVSRIRGTTVPPGSTYISAFDEHVTSVTPDPLFSGDSTLNRGDVIEIQGPAASGKTQLLYFFTMTCVLPNSATVSCDLGMQDAAANEEPQHSTSVLLGGRAKCAVIFDCDGRWRMGRLHAILTSYITSKFTRAFALDTTSQEIPKLTFQPSIADLVVQSLSRVHIFRPTSSLALASTLFSLPTYHRTNMPDEEILMIFVDSISAFHHSDKWRTEQAMLAENSLRNSTRTPSTSRTAATAQPPSSSLPRVDTNAMAHVINTIQMLRQNLGIITFMTNWAMITPEGKSVVNLNIDESAPWFGQHLSSPYPSLPEHPAPSTTGFTITHHITLPGTAYAVPQFPVGTAFARALENEERMSAVDHRKSIALLRTPITVTQSNHLEGDPILKSKIQYGVAVGSFEFSVRDGFVGIE